MLLATGFKILKKSQKIPFVQASEFGLGYGIFTNVGYNASNRFVTSGLRNSYNNAVPMVDMAYGYRKKFSFTPTRYFNTRVYNRKYRRSVYIHRGY